MSGLEIVGIVASIVQVADLGAKISVNLCSFYRTVKNANNSMRSLSNDVSLTCSVLHELGKALEQDSDTKICSSGAFSTTQDILKECREVFEKIDSGIEKREQEKGTNRRLRGAQKFTLGFQGPDLDLLKSNLERLKSTMLLMLNVLMYAGQIRKDVGPGNIHLLLFSPGGCHSNRGQRVYLSGPRTAQRDRQLVLRIRNGVANVHSVEVPLFQATYGHSMTRILDDPFFKFREVCVPRPDKGYRRQFRLLKRASFLNREVTAAGTEESWPAQHEPSSQMACYQRPVSDEFKPVDREVEKLILQWTTLERGEMEIDMEEEVDETK
ncbi:uncharacterized protein PGRI_085000 [Penicillium griseofulvum]|uniref:Fungal N-terminal domain-containing protein n=1 Tax=Penicillium patulum TaxID=5078 RepID=A0A135LTF8_PENPA|nr:uncharacterized protein PGRI_085000 [Penicillium griseofulvum]KXG52216.1 hypothetical protein PGRI_085000 [Penicillium griseofulvum]